MVAMQVIVGRALNPDTTITALTPGTGDSFSIRDFPDTSPAYLEGLWYQAATAGIVRVRSPRMHDFVQNIRYRTTAAAIRNQIPDDANQVLYPNDPLTFEMSGGAAETDSAALLVYYNELPGIAAKLATWEQIKSRIVNLLTVEVACTGPVVAGDWSPGNPFNSAFDLLKADTEYAVLGYHSGTAALAVALSGSDTGNLKVGGPGTTEDIETRDWFVSLSRAKGTPHIPVFNSNNRGSTNAFVALNTAAGTVNVDFLCAQLSK